MIGVFDSGFGGLSVLREIENVLPELDYIYLGDNARAPYGDKDQETIYQYTKEAVDYFFTNFEINLVILACNTASAEALRKLQQEYLPQAYPGKNVLGVIRPVVEVAAGASQKKKIVVLGTQATVDSGAYQQELFLQDKNIIVYQQACPLLVPLVEQSLENTPAASLILGDYLENLKQYDFDTLILGCTHYVFFQEQIKHFFQGEKKILDSAIIIASKLKDYLARHPEYVLAGTQKKVQKSFLTTGSKLTFDAATKKFLGREINSQHINLK